MTNHPMRKLLIPLVLLASLAACNMPASQTTPSPSVNDIAATIVASTLAAQPTTAASTAAITPFASPAAALTTPTGQPTLFINTNNASCRSGPGPDFKVLATFAAGTNVDMLGKDSADNFWIVKDPATGQSCWIQVMDGTPGGSFDKLPEMTPQAVTVAAPGKPSRGNWNFSCDNTSLTTILVWNPTTGTANGFRIARQGSQIADVPGTQTSYTDKIPFTYGSSISYSVIAYNDAGVSPELTWNFHCP